MRGASPPLPLHCRTHYCTLSPLRIHILQLVISCPIISRTFRIFCSLLNIIAASISNSLIIIIRLSTLLPYIQYLVQCTSIHPNMVLVFELARLPIKNSAAFALGLSRICSIFVIGPHVFSHSQYRCLMLSCDNCHFSFIYSLPFLSLPFIIKSLFSFSTQNVQYGSCSGS